MEHRTIMTHSPEQTMNIAHKIGQHLKGGECIQLSSDVGGGKTTFTRGLAKGAGSSDHVSSPTFTISKVYRAENFDIVHFDFYRLNEPGLIEHELAEVQDDANTVVVVEWSDIVEHVLPEVRLVIDIVATSDYDRELRCSYPEKYSYLLK